MRFRDIIYMTTALVVWLQLFCWVAFDGCPTGMIHLPVMNKGIYCVVATKWDPHP